MNKREISIISTTFLISTLFYLIIFTDIVHFFKQKKQILKHGEVITKQDLIDLSERYTKDKKAHRIKEKNSIGKNDPVVAFKFETWQIEEIINANKALNFANGEKPDNIIIYMAKESDFWDGPFLYPEVSVSILGTKVINGEEKLLDKNTNDKPDTRIPGAVSIYNKATACPPGCPKSI